MVKNRLKERLVKGDVVVGPFLKISDPAVVEIAAYAGFDFVIIDQEHGPISTESAQHMVRAAELSGITPIIRVQTNDESTILKALDIGVKGIEVPHISNKEQALLVRNSVRFAPEGKRGVCCYVRSVHYSHMAKDAQLKNSYFKRMNEEMLVIGHIEGVEGIHNIDDILQEDAIDVVFIGPYDLSQSLGKTGQVDHPQVQEKMQEVIRKAKEENKIVGTFVDNKKNVKKWMDIGVRFLAYSVDVGMLYQQFHQTVSFIKSR